MKVKNSAILNKLYSLLDRSLDFAGFQDLIDKADCFCTEDSNDYRDCDYAEYVEKGIEMVIKAQKRNEIIWRIYDGDKDGIIYIVGTLEMVRISTLLGVRDNLRKKLILAAVLN